MTLFINFMGGLRLYCVVIVKLNRERFKGGVQSEHES